MPNPVSQELATVAASPRTLTAALGAYIMASPEGPDGDKRRALALRIIDGFPDVVDPFGLTAAMFEAATREAA